MRRHARRALGRLRRAPASGASPHAGLRHRWLFKDRRAATALEFALVGPPAILMTVFMMEVTYDYFAQAALDSALQVAARNIQVGNAQAVTTAASFRDTYLCPALGALVPCSAVSVSVQAIATNYYTDGSVSVPLITQASFCPGMPNKLMLVEALYTGPSVVTAFVPSMGYWSGSAWVHATVSTTAFINENFPITATPQSGC